MEGDESRIEGKRGQNGWNILIRDNYSKPLVVRPSFTLPTRGLKSVT